jgi:opacity protein-like surface antigen
MWLLLQATRKDLSQTRSPFSLMKPQGYPCGAEYRGDTQVNRLMSKVIRLLLTTSLLAMFALAVVAQSAGNADYPKVEVFVGFSALGEAEGNDIGFGTIHIGTGYATPSGFETSVIRNFTRHIGLKADFSAHFKNDNTQGVLTGCTPVCSTVTQDVQIKTRVYNFLAGPEFKLRNSSRLTPFAHVLAGVAHTSANFTTPGPTFNVFAKRSNNGFAMALGGGLDIRATKRVSFRGQMDYNPVFTGDRGSRDLVRISLGVLFH